VENLRDFGMILPRDQTGTLTPDQHVSGVPSVRHLSQFVSATRDPRVAERYTVGGLNPGNVVVEIDPRKVPGPMLDVGRVPGILKDPVNASLARQEQEVLFVGPVPRSAIVSERPVPPLKAGSP